MKAKTVSWDKKINEIFSIEPNDLDWLPLTNFYKRIVSRLKIMPFFIIIPFSILLSIFSYFLLGYFLIKLVSFFQKII